MLAMMMYSSELVKHQKASGAGPGKSSESQHTPLAVQNVKTTSVEDQSIVKSCL